MTPGELRAVFDRDFRTPLLMSWNVSLGGRLAPMGVRYRLHRQQGKYFFGAAENSREINPAIYVPGASTVANTQARRPHQDYSRIGLCSPTNTSKYARCS